MVGGWMVRMLVVILIVIMMIVIMVIVIMMIVIMMIVIMMIVIMMIVTMVEPGHRAVLYPGVCRVPAAEPRHGVHEEGGGQVLLTSPLTTSPHPSPHHLR